MSAIALERPRARAVAVRRGLGRATLFVLVLAVLWGLWEAYRWFWMREGWSWPFVVDDTTMPQLHMIFSALFDSARPGDVGPRLITILLEAAAFTAKEAAVGFALGSALTRDRAPVRIGLVGCGRIAERGWIPAIATAEVARLVSVADVDADRCALLAPDAAAYTSSEQLVAAGGVDALIVATPAGSHLADAQAAAAAGLPCLVEKPPAPDAAQAHLLAALVPAPWIGFNRRFEPTLDRMRERLPDDRRLHLKLTFHYRRASWQPRTVQDEALLDVGTHLLDLARWLSGSEIRRVRAPLREPHRCDLELELDRGSASLSCRSNRLYFEGIEVRDAQGSLLGAESRGGLARSLLARLDRSRRHPLVESLAAQLTTFCAAVRNGDFGGLATAVDGVAVMEAVEGARRSAADGGVWVDLGPVPRPD